MCKSLFRLITSSMDATEKPYKIQSLNSETHAASHLSNSWSCGRHLWNRHKSHGQEEEEEKNFREYHVDKQRKLNGFRYKTDTIRWLLCKRSREKNLIIMSCDDGKWSDSDSCKMQMAKKLGIRNRLLG